MSKRKPEEKADAEDIEMASHEEEGGDSDSGSGSDDDLEVCCSFPAVLFCRSVQRKSRRMGLQTYLSLH